LGGAAGHTGENKKHAQLLPPSTSTLAFSAAFEKAACLLDGPDVLLRLLLLLLLLQVGGIIETKRPDQKNALYLETIRRGDLLLNRVQKLSRVVDVD
jgi:26S proteasome regulatory subunit N7